MKTKEEIMQMISQRQIEIELLKEILDNSQLTGRSKSKGADIIPSKGKLGVGLILNKTNLSPREPAVKKKKYKEHKKLKYTIKELLGNKQKEKITEYIRKNWKKKTDKILAESIKEEFGVDYSANTVKKRRAKLELVKFRRPKKKLKYKDNINELARIDVNDKYLVEG